MSCSGLASTGLPLLGLIGLGGVLLVAGAVLVLLTRSRRARSATTIMMLLLVTAGLAAVSAGFSPAHAATGGCTPSPSPSGGNSAASTSSPSSTSARVSPSIAEPTGSGATSNPVATGSGPNPSDTSSSSTSSPSTSSPSTSSPSSTSPSPTGTSPTGDDLTITQTSTMTGLAPGIAPTIIAGTIENHGTSSTFVTTVTVSIGTVVKAAGATTGSCDATDFVLLDPAMPVGQTLAPGESADFSGARIGFSDKATNQDACQSSVVRLLYVSA